MYGASSRADLRAATSQPWRALPAADGWDQLVLPAPQLTTLQELAERARAASGAPAGDGRRATMALFSGDRGTGKTLATRVIAGELSARVIEIDAVAAALRGAAPLAATLDEARREAERDGAVLVFDDAGAALAPDPQHNHGAPLPERCADYPGLVVFCSPVAVRLSEAAAARFDAVVEFPVPGVRERAMLWRSALPATAYLRQSDIVFVAEHFRLSGGAIHACAEAAARTAQSTGAVLGREELARALTAHYSTWVRSHDTERALAALREPEPSPEPARGRKRREAEAAADAAARSRLPWRRRPREQN